MNSITWTARDAGNAALVVAVAAPWFALNALDAKHHSLLASMAADPIVGLNVAFFLLVDVLFWVISLLQNSTWLIDPFWTLLPVLMHHYLESHPLSPASISRGRLV